MTQSCCPSGDVFDDLEQLVDAVPVVARVVAFVAPGWSPDGRKLTFIRLNHTKKLRPATGTPPRPRWPASDLWVMNADGSGQRNLTRTPYASDGWGATWSRSQSS